MLGRVYGELLADYPKAEKYLNQAILINKQRGAKESLATNYQYLGIVYSLQQKFPDAMRVYNEAIALSPNNANNYLNLGVTYQQMGNEVEAKKNFEKAFQLDPSLRR
jgi:tetratricopeptide (TPR) repeat protein